LLIGVDGCLPVTAPTMVEGGAHSLFVNTLVASHPKPSPNIKYRASNFKYQSFLLIFEIWHLIFGY
jgi:hypothetical protein